MLPHHRPVAALWRGWAEPLSLTPQPIILFPKNQKLILVSSGIEKCFHPFRCHATTSPRFFEIRWVLILRRDLSSLSATPPIDRLLRRLFEFNFDCGADRSRQFFDSGHNFFAHNLVSFGKMLLRFYYQCFQFVGCFIL